MGVDACELAELRDDTDHLLLNAVMISDEGEDLRLDEGLSIAARSAWAKYDHGSDGYLPLWRHMADSDPFSSAWAGC